MKKAYLFSALTLLCMGLCGCTVKAGAFSWILIILSLWFWPSAVCVPIT